MSPSSYRRLVDRHLHVATTYSGLIASLSETDSQTATALTEALSQRLVLCVMSYVCEILDRHRKPIPLNIRSQSMVQLLELVEEYPDADELLGLLKQSRSWLSRLIQIEQDLLHPVEPDFSKSVFSCYDDTSNKNDTSGQASVSSNIIAAASENETDIDLNKVLNDFKQIVIRQRACNEEY